MPPRSLPPISAATAEFGQRIRTRREQLGWSLEDAGHACKVSWSMIGLIERGLRNPSLHVMLRIAHGLDIDLGLLTTRLPDPPPAPKRRPRAV